MNRRSSSRAASLLKAALANHARVIRELTEWPGMVVPPAKHFSLKDFA